MVKPCRVFFFYLNRRTIEVVELRLRGSATIRYSLILVPEQSNKACLFPGDEYDISWTMPQCVLCLRQFVAKYIKFGKTLQNFKLTVVANINNGTLSVR